MAHRTEIMGEMPQLESAHDIAAIERHMQQSLAYMAQIRTILQKLSAMDARFELSISGNTLKILTECLTEDLEGVLQDDEALNLQCREIKRPFGTEAPSFSSYSTLSLVFPTLHDAELSLAFSQASLDPAN